MKSIANNMFHTDSEGLRSDGPRGISIWLNDTDHSNQGFFIYSLGANSPCRAPGTMFGVDTDEEASAKFSSDTLRSTIGRSAATVVNDLGDEVMNLFRA